MFRLSVQKILLVLFFWGSIASAQASETAETTVESVSEGALAAIQTHGSSYSSNPSALKSALSSLLQPVVDFDSIARGIMGSHYDIATPQQRAAFSKEFKVTLVDLYADTLIRFEITDIKVRDSASPSPDRATVNTIVTTRGDGSYLVQYSMRKDENGNWKARNMILDGVNIGLTYRSQFDSAVRSRGGDIGAVITDWAELIKAD